MYLNHDWAVKFATNVGNWEHFSLETILKDKIDQVVTPGANTIEDLYLKFEVKNAGLFQLFGQEKREELEKRNRERAEDKVKMMIANRHTKIPMKPMSKGSHGSSASGSGCASSGCREVGESSKKIAFSEASP